LSSDLLKAQFEILKPDVIIFAVGSGRDKYIKETFGSYKTIKVIESKRLWHFEIGDTKCFRINHPCARIKNKQRYLDTAIELAKSLA